MGQKMGSMVGFDLAHAVGNVTLDLNKWNVDLQHGAHTSIYVLDSHLVAYTLTKNIMTGRAQGLKVGGDK